MNDFEISVEELKRRLDRHDEIVILDVREPDEFEFCNIGGYLIPLEELPRRMTELDKTKEIAVICHYGGRSSQAVQFLRHAGFTKARNVSGGIETWAERLDPGMPRY
jgi:adenylyltransferase/sulfurtransferase